MPGWVYIMASRKHGTLYTGVTNELSRRAFEHKEGLIKGFTSRYGVHRLVWYEEHDTVPDAILREKEVEAGVEDPAYRGDEPAMGGSL